MATKTKKAPVVKDETIKGNEVAADNVFMVDPALIKLGRQSRKFDHSEDAVMEMVNSFSEDGQLEPVQCRETEDGSLESAFGQRRIKAAIKFNEIYADKPMKLMVVITRDTPEDAFLHGITENEVREDTSVVDQAFNHEVLRKEFKFSDKDICKRFKMHPPTVSRMKKLLGLRPEILKLVHAKTVPFDTACDLADLTDKDQDEILAKYTAYRETAMEKLEENTAEQIKDALKINTPTEKSDKVKDKEGGKVIKEAIKDKVASKAEKGEAMRDGKKAKTKPLTLKQFKDDVLDDYFSVDDNPEKMKLFGAMLMDVLNGKSIPKFIKKCKEEIFNK